MNAKENTGGFQPLRIVSSVFGLSGRVSRRFYAVVGFGLMTIKYVAEAAVIYLFNQMFFPPLAYHTCSIRFEVSRRVRTSRIGRWPNETNWTDLVHDRYGSEDLLAKVDR